MRITPYKEKSTYLQCTDKCAWDPNMIKANDRNKWTEEGRSKQNDETVRYISDLLKDAKVHNVHDLQDIPIEATFVNRTLKSWRILTEVI